MYHAKNTFVEHYDLNQKVVLTTFKYYYITSWCIIFVFKYSIFTIKFLNFDLYTFMKTETAVLPYAEIKPMRKNCKIVNENFVLLARSEIQLTFIINWQIFFMKQRNCHKNIFGEKRVYRFEYWTTASLYEFNNNLFRVWFRTFTDASIHNVFDKKFIRNSSTEFITHRDSVDENVRTPVFVWSRRFSGVWRAHNFRSRR